MHLLNNYNMLFLVYQQKFSEFEGFNYTAGKVLKIPFQRCITCPQIFKTARVKEKRKDCSHLMIAYQGGQMNHNGQTIVVLFHHVFY
jgi:hypothetical protein